MLAVIIITKYYCYLYNLTVNIYFIELLRVLKDC